VDFMIGLVKLCPFEKNIKCLKRIMNECVDGGPECFFLITAPLS